MIAFTIFSESTGEVVRRGMAPDDQVQYQCQAGELIVYGEQRDTQSYYNGMTVVDKPAKPTEFHEWDTTTKSWLPNLESAKKNSVEKINQSCRQTIISGFTSSALGEPHRYDSEETDQMNLVGAVATGTDLPYKCADRTGAKAFRFHTAEQMRAVLSDGALVKLTYLQRATALKQQITAAASLEELLAVSWTS